MKLKLLISITALSFMMLMGCGGQDSGSDGTTSQEQSSSNGLTEFEMTNGIGPVTEVVEIGEIDASMAEQGEQIFETKCSSCHKMTDRYVGPPLGNVLEDRTPAYVMNMMLNPDEMVKKHPEAKKMLSEYMTPMPFQNVSREQARAIVEYLASQGQQQGTN